MASAPSSSGSLTTSSNPSPHHGITTKENEKNANKLQTLYRHMVRLILIYFHTLFPRDPGELYKELKQHRQEIKALRFSKEITKGQQNLIFPPNSKETISDKFDPTLMRILISKFANTNKPNKFWVTEPPVTDQSKEANIVRLLRDRNNIQHIPGYISNDAYKEIAKRVIDTMVALGEDRKTFDNLLPPVQYGSFQVIDNYSGRDNDLNNIHEIIENANNEILRLVIHGMGGVGKSELIRKCYDQLKESFDSNILWINSTTQFTLESSFQKIARKLDIPIKDENGQFKSITSIIDRVHQCLQTEPVLFVFDDVSDIKSVIPFLPKWKPSCTIITTQIKDWPHGGFKVIQLNQLSHRESKSFIVNNLKFKINDKQISVVLSQVDGHPLAMQQFVSAINNTMLNVDEFIKNFKDESASVLKSNILTMQGDRSTINTIKIATNRLRDSQDSKLAYDILNTISYLYGENISFDILKMIFSKHNVNDLDLAINKLSSLSFINKKVVDSQNVIIVHSLVQKCLKWQHKENQDDRKYLNKCLAMFERQLDVDETVFNHELFGEKWYNDFINFVSINMKSPNVNNVLHKKAKHVYQMLTAKGKFNDSIKIMKLLMNISTEQNGSSSKTTLRAMFWHARCYDAQGESDHAVGLYEDVLQKQRTLLREQHPNTLETMHNLAWCYHDIGETDRAIEMYEEVLKERKMFLGEQHKDTLETVSDLAWCHFSKGETDIAIALYEDVVPKYRKVLGEEHQDTLVATSNLANCYHAKGERDQAIKMNEEVLQRQMTKVGEQHPDTLATMHNLAFCYGVNGENDRAIKMYEKVIQKRKTKLGEQHPETLITMDRLACFYRAIGETDRAIEMHRVVMRKRKTKLGEKHPATLRTIYNLAWCYQDKGEIDRAIEMYEDVQQNQKIKIGEQHVHTQETVSNLTRCYELKDHQKKFEEILRTYDIIEVTSSEKYFLH